MALILHPGFRSWFRQNERCSGLIMVVLASTYNLLKNTKFKHCLRSWILYFPFRFFVTWAISVMLILIVFFLEEAGHGKMGGEDKAREMMRTNGGAFSPHQIEALEKAIDKSQYPDVLFMHQDAHGNRRQVRRSPKYALYCEGLYVSSLQARCTWAWFCGAACIDLSVLGFLQMDVFVHKLMWD